MTSVQEQFRTVLEGANYKVIALDCPWLQVFVQNLDGRAALVFRELAPIDLFIDEGRGFRAVINRNMANPSIVLSSIETGANPLFVRLVDFVLDEVARATGYEQALRMIADAVSEFKIFFGRRGGRLSMEQIRGLVAELEVLKAIAEHTRNAGEAISTWKGPFASDGIGIHDFVFPQGQAIEVKSAKHPASSVRVSSPDQLRPSESELRLVVIPIEQTPASSGEGKFLVDYVAICLEVFQEAGAVVKQQFEDALSEIAREVGDDYYKQWKFVCNSWKCYRVVDGFPAIPKESIPPGIGDIKYSIDLPAVEPFKMANDDVLVWG